MQQGEAEQPRPDELTGAVIGACIEVHRHLGPGLLESAYEQCVCHELTLRGLTFERQRPIPRVYKGLQLECGYRADLIVERSLLVEIKAVEHLLPLHKAQVITYLMLTELRTGLLVNFHVSALKQGLRRLINPKLPSAARLLPGAPGKALTRRMP
jgi:GxxExxY protein